MQSYSAAAASQPTAAPVQATAFHATATQAAPATAAPALPKATATKIQPSATSDPGFDDLMKALDDLGMAGGTAEFHPSS